MGGGGSKAVWNFSENSSDLVAESFPINHKMQPGCHTTCGGKVAQPVPTKATKRSDDLGKWKSECGLDDLDDTDQSKSDKGNAAEPDNEHLRTNSWTCS